MNNSNPNHKKIEDVYNIVNYTDKELFDLLDLNSPSDRELEGKIIMMVNKYENIGNDAALRVSQFYKDIYNHFFQESDDDDDLSDDIDKENDMDDAKEGFELIGKNKPMTGSGSSDADPNKALIQSIVDQALMVNKGSSTIDPTTVGYSQLFQYSKDKINPVLKETIKRIISIDSQFRDVRLFPLTTSFTFNLSEPLKDVVNLKLYSVHIPYTWYTINKNFGSNFFYLKGSSDGINTGNYDISFVIPYGNYTPVTLKSAVNDAIAVASTSFTDINFGATCMIYNDITSTTTLSIDMQQIYNQSNYYISFPNTSNGDNYYYSPYKLNDRVNSIQAFLGYENNIYSLNSTYSYRTVPLSTTVDKTLYDVSMTNNYFNIYTYVSVDGGDFIDLSLSQVINSIKIQLDPTILIPGTQYTRSQLAYSINTDFSNNKYIDTALTTIGKNTVYLPASHITKIDISGINHETGLPFDTLTDGYGEAYYELSIKLHRKTTANAFNTKNVVVFPDESAIVSPIWTGANSAFQFKGLVCELNDLVSETFITNTNYKVIDASYEIICTKEFYGYLPPKYSKFLTRNTLILPIYEGSFLLDDGRTPPGFYNDVKINGNVILPYNDLIDISLGTGLQYDIDNNPDRSGETNPFWYQQIIIPTSALPPQINGSLGYYQLGQDFRVNIYGPPGNQDPQFIFLNYTDDMIKGNNIIGNLIIPNLVTFVTSTVPLNNYVGKVPSSDLINIEGFKLEEYIGAVNTSINNVTGYTHSEFTVADICSNELMGSVFFLDPITAIPKMDIKINRRFDTSKWCVNLDSTTSFYKILAPNDDNIFYPGGFYSDISLSTPISNLRQVDLSENSIMYSKFAINGTGYNFPYGKAVSIRPNTKYPTGNYYVPELDVNNAQNYSIYTYFGSYIELANSINSFFRKYIDTFSDNILYGSSVTFTPINDENYNNVVLVKLVFNINVYLTHDDYYIKFHDICNNQVNNSWSYYLGIHTDISYNLIDYTATADHIYSEIAGTKPILQDNLYLNNSNNKILITPAPNTNGLSTPSNANDYVLSLPVDVSFSKITLLNTINDLFKTHVSGQLSSCTIGFSNVTSKTTFRIVVNKMYTGADYYLDFYDPYSFSACIPSVGTKTGSINNTAWDSTLGWILGFRASTAYDLTSYAVPGTSVINVQADTTLSVCIYNYFMIVLDDYNQNRINDGIVTTSRNQTVLSIPKYVNTTTMQCDPITGRPVAGSSSSISQYNNLTQKQVYAAQTIIDTQNNVRDSYLAGPFSNDVFALVPMKVSGMANNSTYIEFGGTLQNQERAYFGPVNITRMTIQLMNDKGELVDLNGSNWSFSIICEQLYQNSSSMGISK